MDINYQQSESDYVICSRGLGIKQRGIKLFCKFLNNVNHRIVYLEIQHDKMKQLQTAQKRVNPTLQHVTNFDAIFLQNDCTITWLMNFTSMLHESFNVLCEDFNCCMYASIYLMIKNFCNSASANKHHAISCSTAVRKAFKHFSHVIFHFDFHRPVLTRSHYVHSFKSLTC